MEVIYTKPEPGGVLYDHDQRSEKKSLGGKSNMTSLTQAAARLHGTHDADLLEEKEYDFLFKIIKHRKIMI